MLLTFITRMKIAPLRQQFGEKLYFCMNFFDLKKNIRARVRSSNLRYAFLMFQGYVSSWRFNIICLSLEYR